jgi:hypothetical protein
LSGNAYWDMYGPREWLGKRVVRYFRRHENRWKLEVLIAAAVIGCIVSACILSRHGEDSAENEAAALVRLLLVSAGIEEYCEEHGTCGISDELFDTAKAAGDVSEAVSDGYRFVLRIRPEAWSCMAVPKEPGVTGRFSFYLDQTDTLRYAPCMSASDPPADDASLPFASG